MKLGDLKQSTKNPRKVTKERLEMLEASLGEFGDIGGLWFNEVTRRFGGGNQRSISLPPDSPIEMYERYEVPTLKGTTGWGFVVVDNEKFPLRFVAWTEEREVAAGIRANKSAGEWDIPMLAEIVNRLQEWKNKLQRQIVTQDLPREDEE